MEYYSVMKSNSVGTCYNMDRPWKTLFYVKKKMKDHTLYDFIYMKHPEKVDLQGQKVSQWLFGEEPVRGNC